MLVKIETYFDGKSWCARGIDEDIFTQGSTLEELFKVYFKHSMRPIVNLCGLLES